MRDRPPGHVEGTEDRLTPDELDALRRTMEPHGAPRIARTIDELEREVAIEDVLIVLIDSAASAAREFFDTLLQVVTHDADPEAEVRDDGGGTG